MMTGSSSNSAPSPEALRALLNALPEAALLLALDGRILEANTVAAQRLGKNVESLLGSRMDELLAPEVATRWRERAAEVARSQLSTRFQYEQNERVIDNTLAPILDASGTMVQLAMFSKDITTDMGALKQLHALVEEKERLMSKLVEVNTELTQRLTELSQHHNTLERIAAYDELTGIYNQRELLRLLDAETNRALRRQESVALMMLDLDQFQQLNERYGESVGNEVLKQVGGMLKENLRSMDVTARYGGDEFALILPTLPPDQAMLMAERIRSMIETKPWTISQDEVSLPLAITVCVGVASLPRDAIDVESLVSAAERALRAAKQRGGNCVMEFNEI